MRCVVISAVHRGLCAVAALLTTGWCAAAAAAEEPSNPPLPALLTNLVQLRFCADQEPFTLHSFRVVAEVCDADAENRVLVLRDASAVEFLQLGFPDRGIEPGATVCLEGMDCALTRKGFGVAVVPGMVVNNDGIHSYRFQSGAVFLRAGRAPIKLQWFNRTGDFGLNLEYEGPGRTRRRLSGSVLERSTVNSTTGATNFSPGLDYRCYEGTWDSLPDFTTLRPVKTGVATNFDFNVRTRNDSVGLEFSGYLKIPRDGTYTFHAASDDGSRLFVGEMSLDLRVTDHHPVPIVMEKIPATPVERNNRPWISLEGTVSFMGSRGTGGALDMRVGNDDIRADIFDNGNSVPNLSLGARVRVSGIYQDVVAEDGSRVPGMLLVPSWGSVVPASQAASRAASANADGGSKEPPAGTVSETTPVPAVVATAAEIKALPPELARQELPVSIHGVVTAVGAGIGGVVIQDSTRGIFVSLQDIREATPLRLGEFCQIDGVTGPGLFAPVIVAQRIIHLGAGRFPQPVHATWDQLLNGSLDTEFGEIDGVVTSVQNHRVILLMQGGKVALDLSEFSPETLLGYENAVVRVRGCMFMPFNEEHQLEAGSLRVNGASVDVLRPAPRDLFDAPKKSIGELLLYDPKAAPFRFLKVNGQIIHGRAGEYFLSDGTNGVHVTSRNTDGFSIGDLVDAVGYLELGGLTAEIREAVIRKTGNAPLPPPVKLGSERLLLARNADKLVQLEARLMNHWQEGSEYVLELQSGFLAFRARINEDFRQNSLPPSGSQLELTGVYVPQGERAVNGAVSGFQLLLHSPADIRVLATPPWWTLRRVLFLAGILAVLLCAVLVWNKQLQQQVQERGRQLEMETHNRQRAELRHAAEAERSRIARDLHDELGAGLTEVSLLASAGLGELHAAEKDNGRFRVIAEKARGLVSGLDVIVWAIDPKRNSLQSFADYIGSYADELLSASGVVCRLKIPIECDAIALPGPARHSLFLAVKEALNNVIRHAAATEVELQISQLGDCLQVVIADNGRGFDWNAIRRGHGLTNLQERLETLRGQCHIESQPGQGTTVKLVVPVPGNPN